MYEFDVIVIGGGITGTCILRELAKYNLKTLLLEKNRDIGSGVTKGNGGVVHSGYDAKNGTLKSKLNVKGAALYPQLSNELDFPYENKGTLTVAFSIDDLETIRTLYENGIANGVPELKILNQQELKEIEPRVNPLALGALHAPSAVITDTYEVAIAVAANPM